MRIPESLYYEDVDLSQTYRTREHEVLAGDIVRFGELTHDRHPLHSDDDFARGMGFRARIAHGLYGLSLMEGLKSELGLYETTSIASVGWDAVRFIRPIVAGDIVHVEVRFTGKRLSRKPGRGIVTEHMDMLNERGEIVLSGDHATLVLCRPASSAAGQGDAAAS